ncbi:phage gene 29 protein family protein [Mycolicibacterium sphagni]|uniref:Minor tail protein n=1 Tax=Mycolicibacterium sphagni TaxID=1786 RepID=A0A255E1F3_9MYCO|nr:hypothetical protein [Mycolicibacterium sphagni]OYN81883.1 hypothetical protein CG716_05420 [Mycolicibacterium sphagni]
MAKTQAECDLDDPREMFAWMFAAGVPDERSSGKFPNQPLIPPMCYGALSEMLYKMGARFHPEEQQLWVEAGSGPHSNFQVAKTTDVKPEEIAPNVAEMVSDQYPDLAKRLADVTPETHKEALAEISTKLLANLDQLRAARARLEGGES